MVDASSASAYEGGASSASAYKGDVSSASAYKSDASSDLSIQEWCFECLSIQGLGWISGIISAKSGLKVYFWRDYEEKKRVQLQTDTLTN